MMAAMAGGGLGGLLGQAGDALGEPRRQLMQAIGLPGKGSELLQQLLGVDPSSLGGQLGGLGVEMATDPLTYAGFLGGGIGSAMAGAGKAGTGLEDMTRLRMAAEAADAANAGRGMGIANESVMRMGVPPASVPDAVGALKANQGYYGRDMARLGSPTGGGPSELGSMVSPNVMEASAVTGSGGQSTRVARNMARDSAFADNAMSNESMLGDSMSRYGEPFDMEGAMPGSSPYALPGMMLSPASELRGSQMAMTNPHDALQDINPLIQALQAQAGQNGMSNLDIAALLGAGTGSIGGGIYAGSRGK